jgi:hypothetical protein
MPGNVKWYCTECGWAAKGKCPRHPEHSLNMGKQWRPGKKGRKTRLWDNRVHGSVTTPPLGIRHGAWPSAYNSVPYRDLGPVPPGLMALGATDFSRSPGSNYHTDPVQVAIRAKNSKPERGDFKPPTPRLGWPFPFDWNTLTYRDIRLWTHSQNPSCLLSPARAVMLLLTARTTWRTSTAANAIGGLAMKSSGPPTSGHRVSIG